MKKLSALIIGSLGLLSSALVHSVVISSIQPIGFITQAITDNVVEHEILASNNTSPHDYALKPSDIKRLKEASLVIWVGNDLETFLTKPIANLDETKQLNLSQVEKIHAIIDKSQNKGSEEVHHETHHDSSHEAHNETHKDHESHEDHVGHDHSKDWHIWMSPEISQAIAETIAERLLLLYPEKSDTINNNLNHFKSTLTETDKIIIDKLSQVREKPYYVFHDAYGYFEHHYGLNRIGEFTINPMIAPGAQQLASIKKNIESNKAVCIFQEPQFSIRVVDAIKQNSAIKIGELDPLGSKIVISKDAYFEFLKSLADSYLSCLE